MWTLGVSFGSLMGSFPCVYIRFAHMQHEKLKLKNKRHIHSSDASHGFKIIIATAATIRPHFCCGRPPMADYISHTFARRPEINKWPGYAWWWCVSQYPPSTPTQSSIQSPPRLLPSWWSAVCTCDMYFEFALFAGHSDDRVRDMSEEFANFMDYTPRCTSIYELSTHIYIHFDSNSCLHTHCTDETLWENKMLIDFEFEPKQTFEFDWMHPSTLAKTYKDQRITQDGCVGYIQINQLCLQSVISRI